MADRGEREADVWLSDEQLAQLTRADEVEDLHLPIPTQMISNGEYMPVPQTDEQKRGEARSKEPADIPPSLPPCLLSEWLFRHPGHRGAPEQNHPGCFPAAGPTATRAAELHRVTDRLRSHRGSNRRRAGLREQAGRLTADAGARTALSG